MDIPLPTAMNLHRVLQICANSRCPEICFFLKRGRYPEICITSAIHQRFTGASQRDMEKSCHWTLLTQISLFFSLFIAFNIGDRSTLKMRTRHKSFDLYFISVRSHNQQTHLLKQMEKVARIYGVEFVIDISEFGKDDSLSQSEPSWMCCFALRYILQLEISDSAGELNVIAFGKDATELLSTTFDNMMHTQPAFDLRPPHCLDTRIAHPLPHAYSPLFLFTSGDCRKALMAVSNLRAPNFSCSPHYESKDDGTGRVHVVGAQNANGFKLEIAKKTFEESGGSSIRGTYDDFERVKNFLSVKKIKDFKMLGVTRIECVFPTGQSVTVVGEAVKDGNGMIQILRPVNGPFYVSPTGFDQMVTDLRKDGRFYKYASVGFTLLGIFSYRS